MKNFILLETVQKLNVILSKQICDTMYSIQSNEQNNREALKEWVSDLDILFDYLSNPSIAFDYGGRFIHKRNGAIQANVLGFSVTYTIRREDNQPPFVFIFNISLNNETYGLTIQTKNGSIEESVIYKIIKEQIELFLRKECI